jgi:hypothetical protein
MPAPPSFIDITSTPFSRVVTQAEFNGGTFGGVANQVWFRRITPAKVGLGIFTNKGGTFKADTTVYQSDGTTVVKTAAFSFNFSFVVIVPAGTYYIKIVQHGGGASNFDFTTAVDELPTDADVLPLTTGQIIINDDEQGFPATVLNSDGSVAGYITTIPAGETAAFLPTGESLWHDATATYSPAGRMHLFDADLAYVMSIDLSLSALPIVTHSDTDFYVLSRDDGSVSKITATGVVTALGAVTFTTGTASAGAVDAAGEILYWVERDGSAAVHRYNLQTMTDMTDLTTIPGVEAGVDDIATTPNANPGDLILQTDGTFVTWYFDSSANDWKLIHLDTDGSLLNAFSFGGGGIDHLFPVADAEHIGIWLYTNEFNQAGQIGIVDLSTGLIASDFTTPLSSAGNSLVDDDPTLFIPSASCTIFGIGLLQAGGGGGNGGPTGEGFIGPIYWLHWHRQVIS